MAGPMVGKVLSLSLSLSLLLLAVAMPAMAGEDRAYEAALERVYQLTYGAQYSADKIDEGVEAFRASMKADEASAKCPALAAGRDAFADGKFRDTMVAYFKSPAYAGAIKGEMRKHLDLADLQAYLAFAESPEGRNFLAHLSDAEDEIDAATDRSFEQSPEFESLVGELLLVIVKAQCPKE